MVWRYTEYAGCPSLTDWVEKQFKLGIILDVDTTDIIENLIDTPEGTIKKLQFKTNDTLRPRYCMRIGENRSSVLNIDFDKVMGLKRRIWNDEGLVEMQLENYRVLRQCVVDVGNFNDFKVIGEYAVKRFPEISKEIVLPTSNFLSDILDDDHEEIARYVQASQSFPDWKVVQNDISKDFYQNFRLYTLFENIGNRLEKRRRPFSDEEKRILLEIVQPLK